MENTAVLMWGMFFGSIGLGFFMYGKKQHLITPVFVGVALMAFPYFISNIVMLVVVGIALTILPYFIRR
ncbi:MAG: hypothetical protein Q9M11_00870 [Mariprofundaceae bacterium]|nr:hypothetical protein [Mariprofundaceae bacterium]